jgi:uncharacterized 2Fe-2S/4Fe-4S cluster protein (DUF4445 family)
LLRSAGLPLNTRCGERGLCQGCLVEVLGGQLVCVTTGAPVTVTDSPRWLRTCDHRLAGGKVGLRLPQRSLMVREPQVVTSFRLNVRRTHHPLWQCVGAWRGTGSIDEAIARAADALRPRGLPVRLAAAALGSDRPTSLLLEYWGDHWRLGPGTAPAAPVGAAIDVGTTTLVVAVVDLATGEVIGQQSGLNSQAFLGDNVLTRISLCMEDQRMVKRLQRTLLEDTLAPMLSAALAQCSRSAEDLVVATVAGNSAMLHLLTGANPSSMGTLPFTPAFRGYRCLTFDEIGLAWPPARTARPSRAVRLHVLPGAAAYVGADVVAGVLASGMYYRDDPCLLVDLGTNAEIVLKAGKSLWGCAAAAGPAFEGAGLTCGVPAERGAIAHLWPARPLTQVRWEVIGGGPPLGLCGTAYLDFLARGRQQGLIESNGRFAPDAPTPADLRDLRHGRTFGIATGRDGETLVINEADMAVLLQAKAAVATGVLCLMRRAGLRSEDIATVFLAGGFGFHMHVDSLLGCGLLPGFQSGQIELVGNTALAGAFASLLDSTFLEELQQVSQNIEVVELNLEPSFESCFIEQLPLA